MKIKQLLATAALGPLALAPAIAYGEGNPKEPPKPGVAAGAVLAAFAARTVAGWPAPVQAGHALAAGAVSGGPSPSPGPNV
jgi:hypothetical protein